MNNSSRRSEILLLVLVTVLTLAIALVLIRWFAPTLLGIPSDLVMVQSSREVAPFYEVIFRAEDPDSPEYLVNDPIVGSRARTLLPDMDGMGPNDLLGFRNLVVPNEADIVVIGDSQTYGNNAVIWENWPSRMRQMLPPGTIVYSMATGGWGAVQYLYVFAKSLAFKPKIIIVAFYTGNDPLETVNLALSSEQWRTYLAESEVTLKDVPVVQFPPPDNEHWQVQFRDGVKAGFTPAVRLLSNMQHPAVDLGYEIMLAVARDITTIALKSGIQPVFTIIPTKELVYLRKIRQEAMATVPAYEDLIVAESARIAWFENGLRALTGAMYVDTATALQESAMRPLQLYPEDINGHPLGDGYAVIAGRIADAIQALVSVAPQGYVMNKMASNVLVPLYIQDGQFWLIDGDHAELQQEEKYTTVENLRLSGLTLMGRISAADLERRLEGR